MYYHGPGQDAACKFTRVLIAQLDGTSPDIISVLRRCNIPNVKKARFTNASKSVLAE